MAKYKPNACEKCGKQAVKTLVDIVNKKKVIICIKCVK